MADITVVHHNLNKQGGGERICMTVLEALQNDHNLTLLLSTDVDSLNDLNDYYNTNVNDVTIDVIRVARIDFLRIVENLNRLGVWKFGYFTNILKHALFNRYCLQSVYSTDLVVSTWDEISIEENSVQYIHWPRRYQNLISTEDLSYGRRTVTVVKLFKSIARRFGKFSPADVRENKLISNSDRTASKVEQWYNTRPQVLNPPIETDGLSDGFPWEKREDGVIFLSRIHPGKNIEWLIDILHQVRQRGHDIHFHIVGPKDADQPEYYRKIRSLSDEHDFVTMEGKMQGEALNKMLREHKYGINGARREQFGIAIAEMVAVGMIPFVPNSGGQREIVGENTAVMFETTEEAVEKISEVHSDPSLAPRIRRSFPDIKEKYGKEAFKKEIRRVVEIQLERT